MQSWREEDWGGGRKRGLWREEGIGRVAGKDIEYGGGWGGEGRSRGIGFGMEACGGLVGEKYGCGGMEEGRWVVVR